MKSILNLTFKNVVLLSATLASLGVTSVYGQVRPLASKRFKYDSLPYKVDTDLGQPRGPQLGYNICNGTTEGPGSLCQTALFNSLDDFCLWAPPSPGRSVGDIEGEMVAWCTKPGRGARVIPAGALTGVQWMRTPDYVQAVGFIDQTKINMLPGDYGGEMDPHGADGRGNPKGGIMFSNAWTGRLIQGVEWHNFMGSNVFCLKLCDPSKPNAARFCEHRFDRIGCAYNAPSRAQNGVFESCEGENQDFPGIYTKDGQVLTYTQPPESLGVITTMPYDPKVPASSKCVRAQSADLYNGQPAPNTRPPPSPFPSSSSSSAVSTSSAVSSSSGVSSTSATFTGLSTSRNTGSVTPSATAPNAADPTTGGAVKLGVSLVLGVPVLVLALVM